MIKATVTSADGTKTLLLLGLSEENVKRLKAQKPIFFNLSEVGLDPHMDIGIIYGKNEKTLVDTLNDLETLLG